MSRRKTGRPHDDAMDERVGYGRPPRAHQFRKGRSGNPAGRPPKQAKTDHAAPALASAELSAHEQALLAIMDETLGKNPDGSSMSGLVAMFKSWQAQVVKHNRSPKDLLALHAQLIDRIAAQRAARLDFWLRYRVYMLDGHDEDDRASTRLSWRHETPEERFNDECPNPLDIAVDRTKGTVCFLGPIAQVEWPYYERALVMRDALLAHADQLRRVRRYQRMLDALAYAAAVHLELPPSMGGLGYDEGAGALAPALLEAWRVQIESDAQGLAERVAVFAMPCVPDARVDDGQLSLNEARRRAWLAGALDRVMPFVSRGHTPAERAVAAKTLARWARALGIMPLHAEFVGNRRRQQDRNIEALEQEARAIYARVVDAPTRRGGVSARTMERIRRDLLGLA